MVCMAGRQCTSSSNRKPLCFNSPTGTNGRGWDGGCPKADGVKYAKRRNGSVRRKKCFGGQQCDRHKRLLPAATNGSTRAARRAGSYPAATAVMVVSGAQRSGNSGDQAGRGEEQDVAQDEADHVWPSWRPKSTPLRIDAARVKASTAESTWISASRGMLPSGASASGAGTPP
jgi:hypothetical protein